MNVKELQLPDFETFEHAMIAVGAPFPASFLHGMVVARLCLVGSPQVCWAELQSELPFLKEGEHAHKLFNLLLLWTSQELASTGSLTMMLPDDDQPLAFRLEALADWCAGFLSVMTETQVTISPILAEVLEDFTLVKEVIIEENEQEEHERDFVEIMEFVRVGALLAHAECAPKLGKEHQTIH